MEKNMKTGVATIVGRRGLLRTMITGAAAAAIAAVVLETTAAKPSTTEDKRRARYQPNSVEVREFYRVNRYPPH
jgi:hypothetical protein